MKKILLGSFFCIVSVSAFAQGYAGAVAALSKMGLNCDGQASCDKKGRAVKLYVGSNLSQEKQIDFGVGRLQAVEVSFIGFGKSSSNGTGYLYDPNVDILDPAAPSPLYPVPTSKSVTANAITFAGVLKFPIVEGAGAVARVGAAYVSSTARYYVQGGSNGSETSTKLKPYIGLGLEYEAVKGLRFVGAYDWTKLDVSNQRGGLQSLGLGAEMDF